MFPCCVVLSWGLLVAQAPAAINRSQLRERALAIAAAEDNFQAFALLEVGPSPLEIADDYVQLVGDLFHQQKNVPRMLAFGQAGIAFCLREARRQRDTNPRLATELTAQAQTIAATVSANTWPGWNAAGVVLSPTDQAFGRDAARLNLRLVQELERGPEALGQAHWLIGAHALAAGEFAAAEEAFERAEREFERARQAELAWMARGYRALAQKGQPLKRSAGDMLFQQTQRELRAASRADARLFADQLLSAEKTLLKSP
jgi:hypothetical protein